MKQSPSHPPRNRIRVMVVMNQPIVRGGIVALLEESGRAEVIAAADHQSSWVDLAGRIRPDVVVVDIEFAGLELAAILAKEFPKTAVIALSAYDSESIREQVKECGVKRFINRSAPLEEIVEAVLCRDKCTSGGAVAGSARVGLPAASFTDEEREILRLIAEGWTMKEIAAELGIELRYARSIRERLMERHGAPNTVALTKLAIAAGLVRRS